MKMRINLENRKAGRDNWAGRSHRCSAPEARPGRIWKLSPSSLSSPQSGGEGRGEEAGSNDSDALAGSPSPQPSPRASLLGEGELCRGQCPDAHARHQAANRGFPSSCLPVFQITPPSRFCLPQPLGRPAA